MKQVSEELVLERNSSGSQLHFYVGLSSNLHAFGPLQFEFLNVGSSPGSRFALVVAYSSALLGSRALVATK